jgi:acyl-coenzyme A thioesterase PaaI-like protein
MNETPAGVAHRSFSEVTAVTEVGEGRFSGRVDPEWTIADKPNGGYLLAMLGRAAAVVSPHKDVISASAHYLRSPDPGPVLIDAQVLRAGRSASQVRVRMSQDERSCVEALVTTSRLQPGTRPFWAGGMPEMSTAGFDECARLKPQTPDGRPVAMLDQVDVRLEPGSCGFMSGRPSGRGELRGWLALPGHEPFDPTSLLYAVDAFPPGTFEIEFTGWVPTLELTVYVRALPEPGPVRVLQRAQMIEARRVDEACFVWDRTGRLVAHGSQLAAINLGP